MDGITASILFVMSLFAIGLIIRYIADKLYTKWSAEPALANDVIIAKPDEIFEPKKNSEIDPKTIAIISAAVATVLDGAKHRVKKVTFVKNRPNAWADSGRQSIMTSHKTR